MASPRARVLAVALATLMVAGCSTASPPAHQVSPSPTRPASSGGAARSPMPAAASPIDAGPEITPTVARQIVAAYWKNNDRANATLDLSLQDRNEEDAAAAIDDAGFRAARAAGQSSVGGPGGTLGEVTVFVPHQSTYPSRFLAFTGVGGAQGTSTLVFVFVRDRADTPWRVSLETALGKNAPVPPIAVAADGYATLLDDAGVAAAGGSTPAQLADRYSAWWNRSISAQVPAAGLAAGPFTTDALTQFIKLKQSLQLKSVSIALKYGTARYSHTAFATTGGGAFVLLVVGETEAFTTQAPTVTLSQSPTHQPFGIFLPPGNYHSISLTSVEFVGLRVAPASPVSVDAEQPGTLSAIGDDGLTQPI